MRLPRIQQLFLGFLLSLSMDRASELWWDPSLSDDEEEYDCGYLDLGAESPASESTPDLNREEISQWAAGAMNAPRSPLRRPSWRSTSGDRGPTALKRQTSVDRDCGICFEYAVAPCRTLCCGKIFCTEHLAAWLHGPNAQGRCPNCENACSLQGGTLSLAVPQLSAVPHSTKRLQPSMKGAPSPLIHLQLQTNETMHRTTPTSSTMTIPYAPSGASGRPSVLVPSSSLTSTGLRNPTSATLTPSSDPLSTFAKSTSKYRSPSSTSDSRSSLDSDVALMSEKNIYADHELGMAHPVLNITSTTPFSSSWGGWSRLMSLVTFLLFLYKLLS